MTDFDHYVPLMFPTPEKNLVLLADDLCRLFVTCMGFTGAQRKTHVPDCEQTNRAIIKDAVEVGDSLSSAVKELESEYPGLFVLSFVLCLQDSIFK